MAYKFAVTRQERIRDTDILGAAPTGRLPQQYREICSQLIPALQKGKRKTNCRQVLYDGLLNVYIISLEIGA